MPLKNPLRDCLLVESHFNRCFNSLKKNPSFSTSYNENKYPFPILVLFVRSIIFKRKMGPQKQNDRTGARAISAAAAKDRRRQLEDNDYSKRRRRQ